MALPAPPPGPLLAAVSVTGARIDHLVALVLTLAVLLGVLGVVGLYLTRKRP